MGRSHWINIIHAQCMTQNYLKTTADVLTGANSCNVFNCSLVVCTETRFDAQQGKENFIISLDFEFEYRMIVWRLVRVFLLQADKLSTGNTVTQVTRTNNNSR
eukprot:scaffold4735_cov104-Skeletonema_dohrnii-CCMP3373.AAC.4